MKKRIVCSLLVLINVTLILFIFSSCSSDDAVNPDNTTVEIQEIKNLATSGTWIITKYVDSDKDETNHFDSYVFSFNPDGTLEASNGTNSINGTWSITGDDSDDDSNDDSDDDDIDFNISFTSPSDFNELTEDWDIVSRTSTKIELKDVSGGNGGTDLLTFEKT